MQGRTSRRNLCIPGGMVWHHLHIPLHVRACINVSVLLVLDAIVKLTSKFQGTDIGWSISVSLAGRVSSSGPDSTSAGCP